MTTSSSNKDNSQHGRNSRSTVIRNWSDHDTILYTQQLYLNRLNILKEDLDRGDKYSRREVIERVHPLYRNPRFRADTSNSKPTLHLQTLNNQKNHIPSTKPLFFNLSQSYAYKKKRDLLKFNQGVRFKNNFGKTMTYRLKQLESNLYSDGYVDAVNYVGGKTQRSHPSVIENEIKEHHEAPRGLNRHYQQPKTNHTIKGKVPKIIKTSPPDIAFSGRPLNNNDHITRHRLTPFNLTSSQRNNFVYPLRPMLERDTTDYEPIESISARNKLDFEHYFNNLVPNDTEIESTGSTRLNIQLPFLQ
ncbi:hypothetical protein SNE40_014066 [Patella caerulea]|uniref:Uncharacterized protein n=1 Tax=Patella caerulea TaxID=87958 RepID=A0AAN8JKI7_PATCE